MRWLAVSLVFTFAACSTSSDPGPSCAQIVDNMMTVTKQQLTGHGHLELQNRQQMIETCEQRELTPAQRRCLATAKDLAGIAACTPRPATPPAPAR